MYSRKSVEPRMDAWGTTALTGYSEDFPSRTTRSRLKPYWKLENRPHFSRWSTILDFTNYRKKTVWAVDFSSRPFPNILKYGDQRWGLPAIWKTRLFQEHIEEFNRTTTGIQSGPHTSDLSRFVMTVLTIMGVMEILCSFRLLLEGKAVKRYQSHQDYSSEAATRSVL